MASDIILCNSTYLYIGSDQTKHIEYISTVIANFNIVIEYRTFGSDHDFMF